MLAEFEATFGAKGSDADTKPQIKNAVGKALARRWHRQSWHLKAFESPSQLQEPGPSSQQAWGWLEKWGCLKSRSPRVHRNGMQLRRLVCSVRLRWCVIVLRLCLSFRYFCHPHNRRG